MLYKLGLVALVIFLISCRPQELDRSKLISWIQELREAKSAEWSNNLSLMLSKEFRQKYLHDDFTTIVGDREERSIIVLANNLSFVSVSLFIDDELYQEYYPNQVYHVQGVETHLGEVVGGKFKPYENMINFPIRYDVIKMGDGFRLMMAGDFGDFYILGKDLPALLERLNRTEEEL